MWRYSITVKQAIRSRERYFATSSLAKTKDNDRGDPYVNLGIRHAVDINAETPYPNLPPIPRPNESIDKKRARLNYQSRKRGILETDLILSIFAKEHLQSLSAEELTEYDKLLDEPDWDIFYWATNKKPVPERWQKSKVLERIQELAKNEKRIVMRMPDLT